MDPRAERYREAAQENMQAAVDDMEEGLGVDRQIRSINTGIYWMLHALLSEMAALRDDLKRK